MVKVAENKIVDLDLLPGTKEEQLKAQADNLTSVPSFTQLSLNIFFQSYRSLSCHNPPKIIYQTLTDYLSHPDPNKSNPSPPKPKKR